MMMPKFKNMSINGLLLVAIGIIGCSVILNEFISYRNNISKTRQGFSQNQTHQLELLRTELDNEIRHLVNIFPAFVKSEEFLQKVNGTTLSGPYFVYSPQLYGQPIDYWDQVQLIRRQIWMLNYFLPLIQSEHLDSIVVNLIDPHNNLIGNALIPFLEIQRDRTSFYSYPVKGLFHEYSKQSIPGLEKIQLSDKYFDQIIYDTSGRKTLYSAMGFNKTTSKIGKLKNEDETYQDNIKVTLNQDQIIFKKSFELSSSIYNWKSKKREHTLIARIVAQKQLTDSFLLNIKKRFGSDHLAIANDNKIVLSTGRKIQLPQKQSIGEIKLQSGTFLFKINPYENDLLSGKLNLVVLTNTKVMDLNQYSFIRFLVIPAGITILLLSLTYFFIQSRPNEKSSQDFSQSSIAPADVSDSIEQEVSESDTDQFLLIEENGTTTPVPFDCISHIRVADHYCTIFYERDNSWRNWMIIERLKTFEKRYNGLLVRLNRSTLINPARIDKIQLLQRKLTMDGEPGNLLTISQTSLDQIKNIAKKNSLSG